MNKVKESAYRCLKDIKYQVDFETIEKYLNNMGYITMFYDEENSLDIKTIAVSALAISAALLVPDMTIRKNIRRAEK